MIKAAVLGAGSWGTALAVLLADNGNEVSVWTLFEEQAERINRERENKDFLPGVKIPESVIFTTDFPGTVKDADLIVMSVPSHAVKEVSGMLAGIITEDQIVVNTAKGIEKDSFRRLSEVIIETLGVPAGNVAVLSGPSHAEEVGQKLPTAVVAASQNIKTAGKIQEIFSNKYFRVYTHTDMVGVEMGGAIKNVIALTAGVIEGLGYGDNTMAALITRGMAEMARLSVKMGANPHTMSGLSGMGDLVVTCISRHSRNKRAGIALGKGEKLADVLENMGMVVEGVNATFAAYDLAQREGVEMPIVNEMYKVLFEGKDPKEAVTDLMTRMKRPESEEDLF